MVLSVPGNRSPWCLKCLKSGSGPQVEVDGNPARVLQGSGSLVSVLRVVPGTKRNDESGDELIPVLMTWLTVREEFHFSAVGPWVRSETAASIGPLGRVVVLWQRIDDGQA